MKNIICHSQNQEISDNFRNFPMEDINRHFIIESILMWWKLYILWDFYTNDTLSIKIKNQESAIGAMKSLQIDPVSIDQYSSPWHTLALCAPRLEAFTLRRRRKPSGYHCNKDNVHRVPKECGKTKLEDSNKQKKKNNLIKYIL